MENHLDIDLLTETLDQLPIGVGIFQVHDLTDIKSIRYVFMNKVILYEMRKEREEVFGKRILDVAPEAFEIEGGLLVMETYRKVAAEGKSINLGLVEYSNHMVAGTYDCSVHYIRDNYVYVKLQNVTDLQHFQNKNHELTEFAHMLVHDLKSPLNTVSGLVKLIEKKIDGGDQYLNDVIAQILRATSRMTQQVNDLLEYNVVGKKGELTQVDCNQLLGEVQQDLAYKIGESNATFIVGELPVVIAYETELRLLFQNLINNAITYIRTGVTPTISIEAKQENGWTFYIKDNGIGIADEHKDKIFKAFHRLHSRSVYEGTGIGLAHCRKIVDLHEGEIGVSSKLGEGSTFYFSIPNQVH
jgi:signal transduction histidine kinase